jgi:hypothetical protein
VRAGSYIWTADDNGETSRARHFDEVEVVSLLRKHTSYEEVGPVEQRLEAFAAVDVPIM